MVVITGAVRPTVLDPATDVVAVVNTLASGDEATPVTNAEVVSCDRLTTVPGDICLYNDVNVVTGVDNCSATGAASHFSTTTVNRHVPTNDNMKHNNYKLTPRVHSKLSINLHKHKLFSSHF